MSAAPELPRKLFYKIHEVAEIVGVEAYVLRYWETKFPMLKPERYGNDERRYRRKDVELLLRIRQLLYTEKFTIAGALERVRKGPSTAQEAEFGQASIQDKLNTLDAGAQQLEFLPDHPEVGSTTNLIDLSDLLTRLRSIREDLEDLHRQF